MSELSKSLSQTYDELTAFDKQKCNDILADLRRSYVDKERMLSDAHFEFVGEPIPPTTKVKVEEKKTEIQEVKAKTLQARSEKRILRPEQPHVLLSDVVDSIIIAVDEMIESVHLENIQHSVIKVHSKGPVIVEKVTDSLLVFECHQLRLHDVKNCEVNVNVANNRIVIENSNQLNIATLTDKIAVDDFNWPRKGNNPHYKLTTLSDYNWIDDINEGAISPKILRIGKHGT